MHLCGLNCQYIVYRWNQQQVKLDLVVFPESRVPLEFLAEGLPLAWW